MTAPRRSPGLAAVAALVDDVAHSRLGSEPPKGFSGSGATADISDPWCRCHGCR